MPTGPYPAAPSVAELVQMATITLTDVSRSADDGTRILTGLSLSIADGELVVIVGPSGSGKTSIIRAIAGLDSIDGGSVHFDMEDMTGVEVQARDVGIVFQSNALFPTHTARANVGFPLKVRSLNAATIKKRVDAEARALGIEQIMDRWPKQLSAGHQQLVQIARALVRVPNVLLLDEPMANLDQPTRKRLRQDLKDLQRGYGVTTVYATNDPVEPPATKTPSLGNGYVTCLNMAGASGPKHKRTHAPSKLQ